MYVFMMIDQDHIVSEPSTYNHLFRRNFKTVPSSPHNKFNYKDKLNVKRAVLILLDLIYANKLKPFHSLSNALYM